MALAWRLRAHNAGVLRYTVAVPSHG